MRRQPSPRRAIARHWPHKSISIPETVREEGRRRTDFIVLGRRDASDYCWRDVLRFASEHTRLVGPVSVIFPCSCPRGLYCASALPCVRAPFSAVILGNVRVLSTRIEMIVCAGRSTSFTLSDITSAVLPRSPRPKPVPT